MTTRILDIMMAAGAALAVLLGSFGAFAGSATRYRRRCCGCISRRTATANTTRR